MTIFSSTTVLIASDIIASAQKLLQVNPRDPGSGMGELDLLEYLEAEQARVVNNRSDFLRNDDGTLAVYMPLQNPSDTLLVPLQYRQNMIHLLAACGAELDNGDTKNLQQAEVWRKIGEKGLLGP